MGEAVRSRRAIASRQPSGFLGTELTWRPGISLLLRGRQHRRIPDASCGQQFVNASRGEVAAIVDHVAGEGRAEVGGLLSNVAFKLLVTAQAVNLGLQLGVSVGSHASVSVVLREALSATTAGDTGDRVTPIMDDGFQKTLDHIRSIADSEAHKGRLFERLMKTYFTKDPIYRERFSAVWLWSKWAVQRPDFDGTDTGIDLVAEERDGRGYCAIQCKCYAPGTRISKPHLDSFIAASAREPFTARIVVDTGDEWGTTARKAIAHLKPACFVLRFGDLASRPFDWPDLGREEPEDLSYRHEPVQPAAASAGRVRRCDRRLPDG